MSHLISILVTTAVLFSVSANNVPTVSCSFENSNDEDYSDVNQETCDLTTLNGLNFVEVLPLQRKNIIKIVGQVFANLTGVTKLDLSDNLLTSLPKAVFSGLQNVVDINLEQNQFTVADFSLFTDNPKLQIINYGHNKITKLLPVGGANITDLRLHNNNIRAVSDLCRLMLLENLDLSVNRELELADFKFKCWPYMKTLFLSESNLITMKNDYQTAFGGMINLEVLNIANNGIVNHCTANYPNLPALVELNLNYNNLKSLNVPELLHKFPKLGKISFLGNAWNCDYFQSKLKSILLDAKVTIVSSDNDFPESLNCDLNIAATGGGDDTSNVCTVGDLSESDRNVLFYWAILGGMFACFCAIVLICSYCFCKNE